jgi:uncharacterized protein YeaO (DUF488 family)
VPGELRIKRAYEQADPADGRRVLFDRLWPRGVSKAEARLHDGMKGVAPSTEHRKWFAPDPATWEEFQARYRSELDGHPDEVGQVLAWWDAGDLTLVYGAADTEHNDAVVLAGYLRELRSGVQHQEDA